MSKQPHPQRDASVLAVVHRAGGEWRVLVASTGRGGSSIIAERTFDAPEPIAAYLDEQSVGQVVDVLPSCHIVCRTCVLPNVDTEQLTQALDLQAETFLVGAAPAHRLARAVLPLSIGETTRTAVLVGWPESAEHACPVAPAPGRTVTYAPDLVALLALLNGSRPSEPLLALDRATGSVAMGITHANGVVFRCTRETSMDDGDWARRVGRAVAETALSVGHTGPFVEGIVGALRGRLAEGHGGAVLAPETIVGAQKRLAGLSKDGAWWERFGVAAGVVLATAHPELSALTRLEQQPPADRPSRIRDIAQRLSRPSVAFMTVAACVVVLMFAPLIFSRLRLAALQLRFPDIETQRREVESTGRRVAMYRSLEKQAWPMTKLLSDIVSNIPETIKLETLRVVHADGSFTVQGEALPDNTNGRTPDEVIALMQRNLDESGLFSDTRPSWELPDETSFIKIGKFSMSAKIVQPYRRFPYPIELDFAKWKLVDREGGRGPEESTEPTEPAAALAENPAAVEPEPTPDRIAAAPTDTSPPRTERTTPARPTGAPPRPTRTGGRDDDGAEDITDTLVRSEGPADSLKIPPPLTKAQIDAMSLQEARKQLSDHAVARENARRKGDEALQERLKQEFDWLKERMKRAQ